jgi:hypothetical protein
MTDNLRRKLGIGVLLCSKKLCRMSENADGVLCLFSFSKFGSLVPFIMCLLFGLIFPLLLLLLVSCLSNSVAASLLRLSS